MHMIIKLNLKFKKGGANKQYIKNARDRYLYVCIFMYVCISQDFSE